MTTQPMDFPAYVDRCVFYEGQHIYKGPKCPHGRTQDELGEVHEEGWTVQQ